MSQPIVIGAFHTNCVRNTEIERCRRGGDYRPSSLDHSEVGHDTVKRRARNVSRRVCHSLAIEESTLNGQQLRESRADDRKQNDADQQLDQCEAATCAASDVFFHWQTVQSTFEVLALVRVKLTVSGLNLVLAGVRMTVMVLTFCAIGSET